MTLVMLVVGLAVGMVFKDKIINGVKYLYGKTQEELKRVWEKWRA